MKYKNLVFVLLFIVLNRTSINAETKFISGGGYGGYSAYAIIESNGIKYRTDEVGSKTNMKLWNQLDDKDRRKLLKYYQNTSSRKADFGAGATAMAHWINDAQGWTALIDELKQKRANKSYPVLKSFYDKELKIPKMPDIKCTQQILDSTLAKETEKLRIEINANFGLGTQLYRKLIDIKWNQISAAVKGVSSNLIPIIVDNFMTGFIVNGASNASQLVATLYQFATSTKDFAKNKPNDAAELVKRLGTLCDMMQTDAQTAKKFVEKDISKLKDNYKELTKLCKRDYKLKEKFKKEKEAALETKMKVPAIDTGLIITAPESKKNHVDKDAEIRKKVRLIYNALEHSRNKIINKYEIKLQKFGKESFDQKLPDLDIYYWPKSENDSFFSIGSSTVKGIKKMKASIPEYISKTNKKMNSQKQILKKTKKDENVYTDKIKNIQARINELINKYKKYAPYGARTENNIRQHLEGYVEFINFLEKDIKKLKALIKREENIEKILSKGLQKRIKKETEDVRPYSSLEDNFINDLIQIRDAIAKLDKIYKSDGFFILEHHRPRLDNDKFLKLINKISLMPSEEQQDRKIKKLKKRLKSQQIEINHQIRRFVIGQNNAAYDLTKLTEFLKRYVGEVNFSNRTKNDVLEVTGVTLKRPYYDIVRDWENGDYMLWRTQNGWILDPQSLKYDMEDVIKGLNKSIDPSIESIDKLYQDVKKNQSALMSMNRRAWSKKFNEYSSKGYKIMQLAARNTDKTVMKKIRKHYVKFYNLLSKIDNVILTRGRIVESRPILQKDIKNASDLLSKKENFDYKSMITRLKNDTKEGTEAYYARKTAALAPMFSQINGLIRQLQDAIEKLTAGTIENKNEIIREFYKKFKEAYESKDVASVASLLSDDWSSSSDSADISDLEDYLGKSFRVFDEIQYNISNINIQPLGDDKYRVSYNVDIVGHIYDDDITHEEKSSVREEVGMENGKVKILRTLSGRFWSIK